MFDRRLHSVLQDVRRTGVLLISSKLLEPDSDDELIDVQPSGQDSTPSAPPPLPDASVGHEASRFPLV